MRNLCDRIVERGGWATAVQAREIISSIYWYANDSRHGLFNPEVDSLGDIVTRTSDLRSLDDAYFRILKSKGITETDWSVWKLAHQDDWEKVTTRC